ncbi:sensor histidine kinase [Actinocrinis puniceicyclus]|uniref:histidine kinase n=1 Tax=Actinocrinis puniceicyclus TaxID=977794 RepID=A0A8J7WJ82_9ACTN|nr:sensor histidine kinase [Actinocrinis puniceicyclus]MBS2963298.1 sensor histidine kinase [Actinocrinis puniceicyclus]
MIDWTAKWSTEHRAVPARYRMFPARLAALGFILWATLTQRQHVQFGTHGVGLLAAVMLAFCAAGWVVWSAGIYLAPQRIGERAVIVALCVFGAAGALLTGLDLPSVAVTFPASATMSASVRFRVRFSLTIVLTFSVIMLVTTAVSGANPGTAAGYVGVLFGCYGLGLGRHAQSQRAATAEQLLAETRRANDEQAHAAALAERGRIAREIHDVLAHSLSALTVQLEAADALLSSGTDPQKAHNYVISARRIAREGLTETRRAIAALREDTPPLRTLLRALAESYASDTGASVTVVADREPADLQPDTSLALYRTAQESLTNARKHAPGAPIELSLVCAACETVLTVTNGAATAPVTALASSGGGYGLAGLRERAELAGGSLDAGAHGDGWRVALRIPASARPLGTQRPDAVARPLVPRPGPGRV